MMRPLSAPMRTRRQPFPALKSVPRQFARFVWRLVLRIEPDNKDALMRLDGRLAQQKRIDEARPLFEKLAAANDSYSDNAHKWLAKHGR